MNLIQFLRSKISNFYSWVSSPFCFVLLLDLSVFFDLVASCRSSFVTLPPVPLQEQPVVFLLLEGALVSWSLAMDERGGHKDLRGSDRRSVIPYVHRRTELYCSSLYA
jgi:hypothetical protein